MTCPKCQGVMKPHTYGAVSARRCESCEGLFLDRADLGVLVEAETDWHAHQSANTATLPRITEFSTPPPPAPPRSRSFIEALFRS